MTAARAAAASRLAGSLPVFRPLFPSFASVDILLAGRRELGPKPPRSLQRWRVVHCSPFERLMRRPFVRFLVVVVGLPSFYRSFEDEDEGRGRHSTANSLETFSRVYSRPFVVVLFLKTARVLPAAINPR